MGFGGQLLVLLAVALTFVGLLAGVRALAARRTLHPELQRKAVHIGMGLLVLPLPWIFDRAWPVVALAALAVAALLVLRIHPSLRGVGSVLSGVSRVSLGEVYFPIAVAVLFALPRESWIFYVVPLAILALADAVAALIGVRYGTLAYLTSEGTKSVEGSVAFFFVAFLAVLIPLLVWTQVDRVETLLIAATVAFLVMMLESVAWRGLDNLFVPLGAYAFLRLYTPLDAAEIGFRLLAGSVLLTFVFFWRKRSALDDAALVASALVGYGTLMIGGWIWLLPPLAFFLTQHLFWPGTGRPRVLRTQGVISVASAGLLCLLVYAAGRSEWAVVPFASSFGTALALYGVGRFAKVADAGRRGMQMTAAVLTGWGAACLPTIALAYLLRPGLRGAPFLEPAVDLATTLVTCFLLSILYFRILPRLHARGAPEHATDYAFSILGGVAALCPCLVWAFR